MTTRSSELHRLCAEFDAYTESVGPKIPLTLVDNHETLDLVLQRSSPQTFRNPIPWAEETPRVGTMFIACLSGPGNALVGIVSVGLRSTNTPHRQPYDDQVYYDTLCLPNDEFPTYFDSDIHLDINETGLPVIDIAGNCVGVTIRTSRIGARVIPASDVKRWIDSTTSEEDITNP